jgi:CDGSH iron-sulfur domain-containing protein 3
MLVQQPAYNFGLYDYFFGKKGDKPEEKAEVEEKPAKEHISQTLMLEQGEKSQQRKD